MLHEVNKIITAHGADPLRFPPSPSNHVMSFVRSLPQKFLHLGLLLRLVLKLIFHECNQNTKILDIKASSNSNAYQNWVLCHRIMAKNVRFQVTLSRTTSAISLFCCGYQGYRQAVTSSVIFEFKLVHLNSKMIYINHFEKKETKQKNPRAPILHKSWFRANKTF